MTEYRFTSHGQTDRGCVRAANEDAFLTRDDVGLWVVADGMGGHSNGHLASAAIVEGLKVLELANDFDTDVGRIAVALGKVNTAIVTLAEKSNTKIGSTVAVLYMNGSRYACLWAGDCRIYRMRERNLTQLTRDHSPVQDLVDRGVVLASEARSHPMSHIVSRAIGVDAAVDPDLVTGELSARDVFLLCSDGLTAVVTDDDMASELGGLEGRAAARRLLELALSRGSPDNVTVLTVACEEKTALQLQGQT
jgi:serine/threonine-protein phosphatase Stp1